MFKKAKSKLLTYLFTDWVNNEDDVETLMLTKQLIDIQKNKITGHKPIIGFRTHSDVTNEVGVQVEKIEIINRIIGCMSIDVWTVIPSW